MSKGIELTPIQIKAYEAGATMFLFPIKSYGFTQLEINEFKEVTCSNCGHIMYSSNNYICPNCEGSMCHNNFPIQKGDKDIFVQEEFAICEHENYSDHVSKGTYICYDTKSTNHFRMEYFPASQMTKEQSRYSFNECIDVRAVRVREITPDEFIKAKIISQYEFEEYGFELIKTKVNQLLKEQSINRTIDNNDYVLLVEFKR